MHVVVPALVIIIGLYIIALYSPLPFTNEGLLIGIAAIFSIVFAAIVLWDTMYPRGRR